MPMAIATGTILVLATWALCLTMCVAVGLLPALVACRGRWNRGSTRVAMWWGLVILTVLIVSLSLVFPLRSAGAAAAVLGTAAVLGLAGIVVVSQVRGDAGIHSRRRNGWVWVLGGTLGLATVYLAAAALGPVTNYDSGLYHLGAIAYAGDYSAIPGLANLYFPFGYANAEFPLAAILGNGPWDGIGYRLLNGLLLVLVMADLGLRARRGRLTAGFYVLAVGLAAALVPMVALSDYLVASPTSDTAVLAMSLVVTAYLSDAVSSDRRWLANGSVAAVVSVGIVMLRPTMVVFAVAVVAVLLVRGWHRRATAWGPGSWPTVVLVSVFVILAGAVTVARDVVISGWLQYPLSVLSFDVPWRAVDPTDVRVPTLGAARDPSDLWAAAQGWGWVGSWISRLPSQWETYEFALLAVAAACFLILAATRARSGLRLRALLLATTPSAIAVLFWWAFTPPSFRFAWGPLFTTAAVPLGWALWRLASGGVAPGRAAWRWVAVAGLSMPVLAVTCFSAVARFDPSEVTEARTWRLGVSIPYAVAPIAIPAVTESTLASGVTITAPTASDQCWTVYPLCSPMVPPTLRLRGEDIQSGFLP